QRHQSYVLPQQNQAAKIQKQKIVQTASEKTEHAIPLQAQRVTPKTRWKKKVKTRPAEFRIQGQEAAHRAVCHYKNQAEIRSPNDDRIVFRQDWARSYKHQDIN